MQVKIYKFPKLDLIFVACLTTLVAAVALMISGNNAYANDKEQLHKLVNQLPITKLNKLEGLISELEEFPLLFSDEKEKDKVNQLIHNVFEHLLTGRLYYLKSDKSLLSVGKSDSGEMIISSIFTGEQLGSIGKQDIKKIRSNNKLRKTLRKAISRLTLYSTDPKQRRNAVENMLNNPGPGNIELLKQAKEQETEEDIIPLIDTALNLMKLDSRRADIRLEAALALSGVMNPVVKNRLTELIQKNSEGHYLETDRKVRNAAIKSLRSIESKLNIYNFIEKIFFGLSLGSVLLLIAIGLSITFGVMGVINMAHGELIMLGAYTTYVIQQLMPNNIGMSILLAIPAAFIVSGLVGILIERGVIQFLKGRPLETLLATFGISLILQQTVRSVFSPLNRQVSSPEWMSGALEINPVLALTYNRLYVLIFSLLVFAVLLFVMKKTALGLYVRAVSQNRDMAKAMGIRSEWVDAMTFGLGSGIAGVAGVALSQLTNVGPNLGQAYIIDSFMVVVFGGVGNLWGTLVGGFTLGVANKFLEPAAGAVLAKIIVLVFIILFIQKFPRGLFPQKGRAAE